MIDITMQPVDIHEESWVYVGLFKGKVVRIREFKNETWYDVEISGVINPYRRSEIEPVDYEPE